MFAGSGDGWSTQQRRPKKGQQARERKEEKDKVTCRLTYGGLPESITVNGKNYFRVRPGQWSGSFHNNFNNFVYYLSKSGTTSQQRIDATYSYPHLSVEFSAKSHEILSAHWTPVGRSSDDDSNPHVRWDNGEFGFFCNVAMERENWDLAVDAKNRLREALRDNFGMDNLPDSEPN